MMYNDEKGTIELSLSKSIHFQTTLAIQDDSYWELIKLK